MGLLHAIALLSQLVNFAAADQLVARPKAAIQFRPAAIKPAVASSPGKMSSAIAAAPGKMFPAAVFQPGAVQGPRAPAAPPPVAPFGVRPVAQRSVSSAPMGNMIPDISRLFQMPIGNNNEGYESDVTTTRRRPTRSLPTEPEASPTETEGGATADVKQEHKEEPTAANPPASSAPLTDSEVADSAPEAPTQTHSNGLSESPAPASPKTEAPPPPPIQSQAHTSVVSTPEPQAQTPLAKTPPPEQTAKPAPVKKANEFPQCDTEAPISNPSVVRKMFASILKITDTSSQRLRQQEMVRFSYPSLSLVPHGKVMHTFIGHTAIPIDAPSSFCQEGNGLRVTMDVSNYPMVCAYLGEKSIVAHLLRTGNGTYTSTAHDGQVFHYTLEKGSVPATVASAGMAAR